MTYTKKLNLICQHCQLVCIELLLQPVTLAQKYYLFIYYLSCFVRKNDSIVYNM